MSFSVIPAGFGGDPSFCFCRGGKDGFPHARMIVLIVSLCAAGSCAQESWESAMAAGQQALTAQDYARAERIYSAALIKAKRGDEDELRVAITLTFLARAYEGQRRFVEAEPRYLEALRILRRVRGPEHPDVAAILNNLGVLNRMHGQYPEAEHYLKQSLSIKEAAHGPVHPDVALTVTNLAQLHVAKGDYQSAASLFERSVRIHELTNGLNDLPAAHTLEAYADVLRKLRRDGEADRLQRRAEDIRRGRDTEG